MAANPEDTVTCEVCGRVVRADDALPAEVVRPAISEIIRNAHPSWGPRKFICLDDLNRFRGEYVEDALEDEIGQLTALDEEVVRSFQENETLSRNINTQFDRELTIGERLADRVASFGGSWPFLVSFAVVLLVWIGVNTRVVVGKPFDPYPYILLNLVLSCLAAIQAPVIMMSQNRQEDRDRLRAENDYRVNLKAELEVRHINAKIDLLLTHQWRRLMEIQQIQMDLMAELARRKPKDGPSE